MTHPDRRIAATATGQLGAFTRVQAHDSGLDNRQLRRRVQSGILDQVGHDTFRSALVRHGRFAELFALCLDLGQPC